MLPKPPAVDGFVRRPHLLGEVLVVLCLLRVYDVVRAAADTRAATAIRYGEGLLRLEAVGRLDVERRANHWLVAHPAVSLPTSYVYEYAHITVTLAVLTWVWWRRADLYRSARNALVLTNVVGLAVFYLFPVAPPRLLPGGGFVDVLADAGFGTTHGGPVAADQYGAMPSLHLAWAVWSAVLVGWLLGTTMQRRLLLLYPLLVTAVVVVTANHYLLDAVVGTALALGSLHLAGKFTSGRSISRAAERVVAR
ncbi:MAG: phosphatase PAP2 family protein, partial [Sporichthyaceae bacterium]